MELLDCELNESLKNHIDLIRWADEKLKYASMIPYLKTK